MDKLRKTLSGQDDEEQGIVTQLNEATTLSWETRIKAFAVCFILGITLSIIGSCLLWLAHNGLTLFAIFYTVGNILSLASTCFLMGPLKQVKKMFAQTRIFATILVIAMFILTLVCAIALKNPILTLICCIVQFLALTWYSLSYIPFARDAVKKCFEGCLGWECTLHYRRQQNRHSLKILLQGVPCLWFEFMYSLSAYCNFGNICESFMFANIQSCLVMNSNLEHLLFYITQMVKLVCSQTVFSFQIRPSVIKNTHKNFFVCS